MYIIIFISMHICPDESSQSETLALAHLLGTCISRCTGSFLAMVCITLTLFRKVRKYAIYKGAVTGGRIPFSGLPKGFRTCFNQSFLHGSLVKVRRRMPFRD